MFFVAAILEQLDTRIRSKSKSVKLNDHLPKYWSQLKKIKKNESLNYAKKIIKLGL